MENRTTNVKVGIVAASATVLLAASLYYFREHTVLTLTYPDILHDHSQNENGFYLYANGEKTLGLHLNRSCLF